MPEDKLTPVERRRLEALALAVAIHAGRPVSAEQVVEYAQRFDSFLAAD